MKIQSEMISEIDYDNVEKELTVTFAKGGSYKYFDVPLSTWDAFIASDSKGKFFLNFIKNKFKTEKVLG